MLSNKTNLRIFFHAMLQFHLIYIEIRIIIIRLIKLYFTLHIKYVKNNINRVSPQSWKIVEVLSTIIQVSAVLFDVVKTVKKRREVFRNENK
jgi:hypothetical protein